MKRFYLTLFCALLSNVFLAQNYCNVNGNLMIYSNYDGGTLNINVNQNIPNLKIGVVSYEALVVNLSGPFLGNVTGVIYAGYNGSNNHCGSGTVTSINGAPVTATTSINLIPAATLSNMNGYNSIICGYSCSITTSQGGCNTIDQIEAYFLSQFSNSVLFAHKVQYGCWSGSYNVSDGGTCCALVSSLQVTAQAFNESCSGSCDGYVVAGAAGGLPPYSFTISGNPNLTNLCAGGYTVQVQDGASNIATTAVTVGSDNPPAPAGDTLQEFCGPSTIADLLPGGSNIKWYDAATGGNLLSSSTPLIAGNNYFASETSGSCESDRLKVRAQIYVETAATTLNGLTITANQGGVSYQWVNCNTNFSVIPGAINRLYTATENGSYAVILSENGCVDTSACVQITSVQIDEYENQYGISVFPNPTDGQLSIQSKEMLQQATIRLMDIKGTVVHQLLNHSGNSVNIDLSALSKGVYFLEINSSGLEWKERIVLK